MTKKLNTEQFAQYFSYYIGKIEAASATEALENHRSKMIDFVQGIPEEKIHFAYAPQKWTVAQLLAHCIDTERIFIYRALAFARGEDTKLPGYDENIYADHYPAAHRTKADLLEEADIVRQSSVLFFKHLTPDKNQILCNFNGNALSVEAVAFMIAGHWQHHLEILQDRYL